MKVERIRLAQTPFGADDRELYWAERGKWPAFWLQWPEGDATAAAYRRRFTLAEPRRFRLHLSGDNLYRLRLDGEAVAAGPELGDVGNYFYESLEIELPAGEHILSALVFDFGEYADYCRMTLRPGFLAAAEGLAPEVLNTGVAAWEVRPVTAWRWLERMVVAPTLEFRAADYPAGVESGLGEGWRPADRAEQAANGAVRNEYPPERLLFPARLSQRLREKKALLADLRVTVREGNRVVFAEELEEERAAWKTALTGGEPVVVPPHSYRRVTGMLSGYHCFYPELAAVGGGGAEITLGWAEALSVEPEWQYNAVKGRRDELDGKYFFGWTDRYCPDENGAHFSTPWWRCGRFFELTVRTGDAAAEVGELSLFDTRYPFESEIELSTSDARFNRILPLCLRTVQMCAHDTFMDCPYYEQLMYIGDARLEALVLLAATRDNALNVKMLELFAASQGSDGFLASRYPSRIRQVIPTFSPYWIATLHDYAMYRGDPRLVRRLIGNAKHIAEAFENRINADGLLEFGQGWNFVDWTTRWRGDNFGVPPSGEYGVSCVVNWLYAYALKHLAELCDFLGEEGAAGDYCRRRDRLVERIIAVFWDAEKGLFADDASFSGYSEHAQCLALLSGGMPPDIARRTADGLFGAPGLAEATIYFNHYYFECCRIAGRIDKFFERMQVWFDCDGLGLATLLERPEPSRSDCHGWSGHPYFHVPATLAGIRPAEFGFRSVEVTPQPGELSELHAEMVHPAGRIVAAYRRDGGHWMGTVILPADVAGVARLPGGDQELRPGENALEWYDRTIAKVH